MTERPVSVLRELGCSVRSPRIERLIIQMKVPTVRRPLYQPGDHIIITHNPPTYDQNEDVQFYHAFIHVVQTNARDFPIHINITLELAVQINPHGGIPDWTTGIIPWTDSPLYMGTISYPCANLANALIPLHTYPTTTINIGVFDEDITREQWMLPRSFIPHPFTSNHALSTNSIPPPLNQPAVMIENHSFFSENTSVIARRQGGVIRRIKRAISSIF